MAQPEQTQQTLRDAEPPRYERKFLPVGVGPGELEALLRLHPAAFSRAYPSRRVNSLYLEQPDLRSYDESVAGVRDRTKLRIRWYGATFGAVAAGQLEIKIKRGLLGTKRRFDVVPFEVDEHLTAPGLREVLRRSRLPADVTSLVAAARPALLNSYWRAYLVSADRRFRLTIDSDLAFYVPGRRLRTPTRPWLGADPIVLELKYDLADEPEAARIASALPCRLTKSSKYVTGMDALYPR